MKSINPRMLVIALLMFAGAGLALAMKPTQRIADTREQPDLSAMIPRQFGEWMVDTSIVPIEPSPEAKALLNKVYNQTLSRTYVNAAGQRIMLSIAYGGDQSDSMQVHRPEVCYAAQGFEMFDIVAGVMLTKYGELPVKRLVATQGNRNEPITYWIVIGEKAALSPWEQKLARLRYGMTGRVPDGLLVRISSIDRDRKSAYQQHDKFVESMLEAASQKDRVWIAGRSGA
jgi:EpsI family protein